MQRDDLQRDDFDDVDEDGARIEEALVEETLDEKTLEEETLRRRSRLRRDLESLLERTEISRDRGVAVVNVESGEAHYFEGYPDAVAFMAKQKGRWYITNPGLTGRDG